MDENTSKVYVLADEQGRIIRCEGGYTTSNITNPENWVQIDEGTGDRFNLCQSHYFPGGLYTEDGVPRYKLVDGKPVGRAEEEIAADLAAIVQPVTQMEQMRADIDFIAAMQGVSL